MIFLWLVSITTVLVIPLAYPPWESGSYFSAALLEGAESINPVATYLPINIFESLAKMQVPAVVVFCVALGVALIEVSGKDELLCICDNLIDALGRIAGVVVRLAPIGIFAIAAAWTSLYPQNSVVVPEGMRIKVPTGSDRFYDFMNTWLELKIKNGQVADAYDRWILGRGITDREPRWSVIRNVLHWVD